MSMTTYVTIPGRPHYAVAVQYDPIRITVAESAADHRRSLELIGRVNDRQHGKHARGTLCLVRVDRDNALGATTYSLMARERPYNDLLLADGQWHTIVDAKGNPPYAYADFTGIPFG